MNLDNPYWDVVQTFPNERYGLSRSGFSPDPYPFISRMVNATSPLELLAQIDDLAKGILTPPKPESIPTDEDMKMTRKTLVSQYSWAIPSNDAIFWLADKLAGQEVIELGAGNGYWAFLLEQVGIPVMAYDKALAWKGDKNVWIDADTKVWHPVVRGNARVLSWPRNRDKALFLCWPPYNGDLAIRALRRYQGDTLVYCGEHEGGCCGDDRFFALLEKDWEEVACFDDHVQWGGMHDYLWVYRRKMHVINEEP